MLELIISSKPLSIFIKLANGDETKVHKVKKIIEDHLGSLFLIPGQKMKGCDHFGAEAKIILPIINSKKLKLDLN